MRPFSSATYTLCGRFQQPLARLAGGTTVLLPLLSTTPYVRRTTKQS